MNSYPSPPYHQARFIIAGIVSILAQGILLTPLNFNFFLRYFPEWGGSALGITLFVLSILIFITIIRSQQHGQLASGIFILIQAFAVAGIYFLLDNSASHGPGAGFVLSGMITILTTCGVFANSVLA